MTRFALALLFVLPCSSSTLAQIELSYSIMKSMVGATTPEILPGGRILMEPDSKTSESIVAVIRVASTERTRIKAQRTLKEFAELIPWSTTTTNGVVTAKYILAGEGAYVIDAMSASWDRSLDVVIGVQPDPKPPIPPPDPVPPPKPIIDVPNDYNVGQVAYKTAPSDMMTARIIAGWYRIGASKLFGGGGLADIETIKTQINTQFANKQCRDQATCQQWDKWKSAVSAAYVAEQVRRKQFSRQDHYTALIEVATALESVGAK